MNLIQLTFFQKIKRVHLSLAQRFYVDRKALVLFQFIIKTKKEFSANVQSILPIEVLKVARAAAACSLQSLHLRIPVRTLTWDFYYKGNDNLQQGTELHHYDAICESAIKVYFTEFASNTVLVSCRLEIREIGQGNILVEIFSVELRSVMRR